MADDTDDDAPDQTPAAATPTSGGPSTAPPPSGPDFTSMVKSPEDMAAAQGKLSAIQQAKTASDTAIADQTSQRLEGDRARMEQAYKVSAAVPDELNQPWDAKAKMAEHSTDPVSAFGSTGSIFAMLASGFTHAPISSALNAGAAAIQAVHAGDERAYQKEFDAWKLNTDLALKRHEIERQAYNDATNLMNSNINAGRTKMELAATKFGDQKAQALIDAGMDKELFELMDSRNKAALGLQDSWDKVQLQHEKVMDLRADPRFLSGDPIQKEAAIQAWNQRWASNGGQKLKYDAEADYISAQKRAHPDWTPEDLLQWKKDAATAAEGDTSADNGPLSTGKLKSKAIQQIVDDDAAKGVTTSIAEATKRYNVQVATPSGNRLDDIAKQINQFDNGKQAIDRALTSIDKHWGSVGVAGYATRGAERVSNIFGSNDTDRSQLAHDIQYLQTIAPRLMQDASSRGLKADADKINSIIAGLNIGDTTANTKRALTEVRDLWDKMQQDNVARRNGTPNLPPAATGSGSTPAASSPTSGGGPKTPRWQSAPIVAPAGPRAEAEGETTYG